MCDDGPCNDYTPEKSEDVRAEVPHRVELTVTLFAADAESALEKVLGYMPGHITLEYILAGRAGE